jgi:hypothetical protein
VGVAVAVSVAVGVSVGLGVLVSVGVAVSEGAGVNVPVVVGVSVGLGVAVLVGVGVSVSASGALGGAYTPVWVPCAAIENENTKNPKKMINSAVDRKNCLSIIRTFGVEHQPESVD